MGQFTYGYYDRFRLWMCSADVQAVKEMIAAAKERTEWAEDAAKSIEGLTKSASAFRKAADHMRKINKGVNDLDGVLADVSTVCKVSDALRAIDEWPLDGDPQVIAAAYDSLFGGIADLVEKIGPLSVYAPLLRQISVSSFFQRTSKNILHSLDRIEEMGNVKGF